MLKNTLLLLMILLFSGCVERGYKLTINSNTHTIIAEDSVDIGNIDVKTNTQLQKMEKAVHKANKAQKQTKKKVKKSKKLQKNKKALALEKKKSEKARIARLIEEKKLKLAQEIKAKKIKMLKKNNQSSKVKILEKKMKDEKDAYAKRKNKALLEEKRRKTKLKEKIKKETIHRVIDTKVSNKTFATTQPLRFELVKKTYHKFGTSEIHGRVTYLNKSNQEVNLQQSKIFLLPINSKLDHWFTNYYLKNKNTASASAITATYLNSTYLTIAKNFEFYGVPEGSYYIIIESNYPSHMAKNKKVDIAKKIEVGKHKKIMAVFSKKL